VVPRGKPAQNLRLAPGLIERHLAVFLGRSHLRHDRGPLDQQIVYMIVDRVDATAQYCEV
jgi:hypothetical protein